MRDKVTSKVGHTAPLQVAIMTPYLTESMGDARPFVDVWGARHSGWNVEIQKAFHGYAPENLLQERIIETRLGRKIFLYKPRWENGHERGFHDEELRAMRPLLAIEGSTLNGETETARLKETGVVVARYSTFYGGNSAYSRKSPEELGYSLDIPKTTESVLALLSHDAFIDALAERSIGKVRFALADLALRARRENMRPIKETPYLERTLAINRV